MDIKVNEVKQPIIQDTQPVKDKAVQDDFSFTLKKLNDDGLSERLSLLIDDITTQGKKLSEHMDIRDMKYYRGKITEFINEVVANSHKFSRENFLDRRGRHRVYGIVKVVNQRLDDLAQELIKTEKSHLNILGSIDEIRGLLLDIIM